MILNLLALSSSPLRQKSLAPLCSVAPRLRSLFPSVLSSLLLSASVCVASSLKSSPLAESWSPPGEGRETEKRSRGGVCGGGGGGLVGGGRDGRRALDPHTRTRVAASLCGGERHALKCRRGGKKGMSARSPRGSAPSSKRRQVLSCFFFFLSPVSSPWSFPLNPVTGQGELWHRWEGRMRRRPGCRSERVPFSRR